MPADLKRPQMPHALFCRRGDDFGIVVLGPFRQRAAIYPCGHICFSYRLMVVLAGRVDVRPNSFPQGTYLFIALIEGILQIGFIGKTST